VQLWCRFASAVLMKVLLLKTGRGVCSIIRCPSKAITSCIRC
jgi:hypothetical protein